MMMIAQIRNYSKLSLLILSCLFVTGCTGLGAPTMQDMFANLAQSIPPIWNMVTAFAYLMGIALILRGVYALKVYGDMRTMMSSQSNLKIPLTLMIAGTALMFLPTMKAVMLTTIFAYSDPMPLSYTTSNPLWSAQSTLVLLRIVQLVGLIAFIRGWVYLAQTASGGGHSQHSFGKSMTHIIGGILAINIEGTKEVLQGTLGF